MKKMKSVLLIGAIASVFASGAVNAQMSDEKSVSTSTTTTMVEQKNASVCRHGAGERKIEIVYDEAPAKVPCRVLYTRDGQTSEPWSARAQEGYCEEKAAALVDTLEGAGWACN